MSAVVDFLFNIYAATLHIGGRFFIRNLRMRRAVVKGTHLARSICNICKLFEWHGLTLVGLEVAEVENDETFVVNCYDVGSPSYRCCKSDLSECYFIKKFIRIEIFELHFVRLGDFGYCVPTLYQIYHYHTVNNITTLLRWLFCQCVNV